MDLASRRDLVLNGKTWKALVILALPVAIINFIDASYNLLDTIFISQVGKLELAAVAFVGPITTVIRSISNGLSLGSTSLIGREIGAGKTEKAKDVSIQLLTAACTLGLSIAVITFIFSAQILKFAAVTESLSEIANYYFRIVLFSVPFIFFNAAYLAIKRAIGETSVAMKINMLAIAVKLVLTYSLIFHFHLGIMGLGISTFFGTIIISFYGIYDLFWKKGDFRLQLKSIYFDKSILKSIAKISLPSMIEKTIVSFSFVLLNKYILAYGEMVLAAYAVTNKVNSMFFSTVTGFGTGLSVFISQNLGARKHERIRKGIRQAFKIVLSVSILIIIPFYFFRKDIAHVFAKDDFVFWQHIVNAMTIYSNTVIPWGVIQIVIGIFEGTGNTRINLFVSLIRVYVFRLGLLLIFMNFTGLEEKSVWVTMLVSNNLTALLSLAIYQRHKRNLDFVY
jgi:putative MATE family efflux protein